MRIDLSRPIPGLLMALPLIAILLSVSRVPISATQPLSRAKEAAIEMTGTAIACAPDVGDKPTERWPRGLMMAATAGILLPWSASRNGTIGRRRRLVVKSWSAASPAPLCGALPSTIESAGRIGHAIP